jgi:hypothetical protein
MPATTLPALLALAACLAPLAAGDAPAAAALPVYGLFSAAAPAAARAAALAAALPALAASLGAPCAAADDGAVEAPAPASLDLVKDDRINVPSRALLLHGARRAFSDLGDARAVSLALGHHAAWQRFHRSGLPLAVFLVDPEALLPPAPGSAPPPALRAALARGGAAWDLLLLGALVPPQRARARAGDAALEQAGWMVPLRWRGWHAYVLSRAGAEALLREGALPLSQRSEAYASSLVDLGLLRALALAPGGGGGGGSGGSSGGGSGGGGGGGGDAPVLIGRPPGWGSAGSAGLGAQLAEAPCDLCQVPEDYSRMGHIVLAAGPSAVIAGLLTTYFMHVTGCGRGVFI